MKTSGSPRGSEGETGDKHVLYELGGRDQVLQFKVEDPLKALHGKRTELWQLAQDPREVVRLLLRLSVVRHVISEGADDLHLQLLHLLGVLEAMSLCGKIGCHHS